MSTEERVIILEFNELTPALMERFMSQGLLPGFSRLHAEAQVWTTDAEETGWRLEPWIQWVTVHTGLSLDEHQVFRLDDASRCQAPRIWDLVSQAGKGPSWICGSMNGRVQEGFNGYMLPDPWCSGQDPLPRGTFDTYYRFIRTLVQEYTNSDVPLGALDHARFAGWMAANGLSPAMAMMIARQLVQERYKKVGWRRAAVLDHLQWAVFSHHYKRLKPRLSTFFLNSTAHYQHVYWRNMEPWLFKAAPGEEEQEAYGSAISFGYRNMDRVVQKCLDLAGDDTTVVFATALSQQPCLRYEDSGGKVLHRPHRMERFLQFAGIEGAKAVPVMSEEFILQARDETHAQQIARRLGELRVNGRQAMYVDRQGSHVNTGCAISERLPRDSMLQGPNGSKPFFDIFYQADCLKSGMHHPDGMLWIRRPDRRHQVHDEKVSLRTIAPTVLDLLGVAAPPHLQASLFARPRQHQAA